MTNKNFISALSLVLGFFIVNVNAQFDDLYFDEADFNTDRDYAYEDVDQEIAQYDNATIDDYDGDEFDEYTTYYTNDYDIDGYQYTNRLDQYRLAALASSYYGSNFLGCGTSSIFFRNLNRQVRNDRFFAQYLSNALVFGRRPVGFGSSRFRSNNFIGSIGINTISGFNNPFGFSNGFNSFNRGFNSFGGGFNSFGGGFNSFGGGYGCPAYGFTAVNNARLNSAANTFNNVSRVNSSRSTGAITRSNSGVRNTSTTKANVRSTSARGVSTSSVRNRTAAPSSRTVRSSANTRTTTRSSSAPSRTSRSSRISNSNTRSSRSSFSPSRTTSRSSSVGSSRSSRSSSSVRSSSSSRPSSSSVRSTRRP